MWKVIAMFFSKLFAENVIDKNSGMELINRPILKPYCRDQFELVSDYKFRDILVPAGYKTNGANIPRVFWNWFPPNSPEYISAALVHDYLCDVADNEIKDVTIVADGIQYKSGNKEVFRYADKIFKEMLTILGCNRFKINCFYLSVRLYHKIRYRA